MRKFVAPGQILSLSLCYAIQYERKVLYARYFSRKYLARFDKENAMAVLPSHNYPSLLSSAEQNAAVAVYRKKSPKQIAHLLPLGIVPFPGLSLLGALLIHGMRG